MSTPAFTTPLPVVFSSSTPRLSSVLPRGRLPPCRRPVLRMQEDSADEDTPSDTYVPAAESVATLTPEDETSKRESLIQRLLLVAAATSRGQTASDSQIATVDDLVMQLEELNPTPNPVDTDLMDGLWTLVYSTAKLFDGNKVLMAAASPVLQLGQVRQKISITDGTLTTEGDLVLFPLTSASVVTKSSLTPVGGERLELVVEDAKVTGGKLAGRLDLGGISFDVPVKRILSRVRNISPETYLDTFYLDDTLRISRSKKGKLYIYTRLD